MKVYITKWALTKGILVCEAEPVPGSREHVVVKGAVPWQDFRFGLGDWYTDAGKAVARAEAMRDKQAVSLEHKLLAMRKLKFPVPDLV